MSDEANPRILYVGNLAPDTTEELLLTLFAAFGVCKSCKIIHEAGSDLYAFIEFTEHREAQMALMAMNKRVVYDRELKVNWATSPGSTNKQDTSNHFHVFVGDLSPDIESSQLREAFAPFGEISDCKVIRDSQTHRSKGFGFICFVHKEEAEMAIAGMNGQWLGGRNIRTNWATGKGMPNTNTRTPRDHKPLNYDEVFAQTSDTNTTIYCGGIQSNLTDELMKETFGEFGEVVDVRVFKEKGFSFIKMDSKEAACSGICAVHGTEVGGYVVKCSWGKEVGDQTATPATAGSTGAMPPYMNYPYMQPGYGYPGYYGYWGYPAGGPGGYPPQQGGYMGGPPQQWGGGGYGDYNNYYNYAGGPGGNNMQQGGPQGGGPPNNMQGPPGNMQGPNMQGPPGNMQGPPNNMHGGGPPNNMQGPPGNMQGGGPHGNMQGGGDPYNNYNQQQQQWNQQQQWGSNGQ